jgi:hypothetical protein
VSGSGAAPELANNQCRSNEVDGILFQNGAHSKAESNVCERNKVSGISVIGSGTSPKLAGSGANFMKCMYLSGERLCRFKRPGPRSKFPERWLLVRLVV